MPNRNSARVALDPDFSSPLVWRPSTYAGIMVLRLSAKPSHDDVLVVCRTRLRVFENESAVRKRWSVEPGRVGEYRLADREKNV